MLVALALIAWDARSRAGRVLALSKTYGVAVQAPALDLSSLTGYRLERRDLVLPTLASDARHWVVQTQAMVAAGDCRVRQVDYDGAPQGREVHWASPFRWWLLAVAQLDRIGSDRPLSQSLERAVLWAGPLLFAVVLLTLGPLVARRLGGWAAAVVVIGLVATFPFAINFYATNADHHGAAQACALLCLLGLTFAQLGRSDFSSRSWFIASGVAGGLGLWISAASMVPVLLAIGFGAVIAAWIARGNPRPVLPWRLWAVAGAVTSVLGYAIEYAPGDFGWRLEVNHPLFALAWLGAGELLARIETAFTARRPAWSRRDLGFIAFAIGAVAAVPVAMLAGGVRVFALSDPFMQALHRAHIAEFQSLPHYFGGRLLEPMFLAQWFPAVTVLVFATWLWRRLPDAGVRAQLTRSFVPSLALLALGFWQIRWWGLAYGAVFVLAAQGLALLGPTSVRPETRHFWRTLLLLALVPGVIQAALAARHAAIPTERDVFHLVERDVAHRLRLRAGTRPLVVASTPDATTALIYSANARGLGTMYWENAAGLRTAAALFAARSADEAHAIIRHTGVTHVLLYSWDEAEHDYVRLARGLGPAGPLPSDTFATTLKSGVAPRWLRRLPHPLPPHPALRGHAVFVFEVGDEPAPDVVSVQAAAYVAEMADAQAAARLEAELARFPQSLAATGALAALQARRRDAEAFGTTFTRMLALLPQSERLALEDRVRVAMVLAIGSRSEQAAGVLRDGLARADEQALRALSPGTLTDLHALSDALDVRSSDPAQRELLAELLPPR